MSKVKSAFGASSYDVRRIKGSKRVVIGERRERSSDRRYSVRRSTNGPLKSLAQRVLHFWRERTAMTWLAQGWTRERVGAALGVTAVRIRQIEVKARGRG